MSQWVLTCKKCRKLTPHSNINPDPPTLELLWPIKPEFPEGGEKLNCPHCEGSRVYQRYQLFMQTA